MLIYKDSSYVLRSDGSENNKKNDLLFAENTRKKIGHVKNSFEFDIVFKNALRFNKDFMAIYMISIKDFCKHLNRKKRYSRVIDDSILIGFSINKKVAKACKRNLIRRRLKAIVAKFSMQQKINQCVLVFVCRKGIMEFDYNKLEKHLHYSFTKLSLMTVHSSSSRHIKSLKPRSSSLENNKEI